MSLFRLVSPSSLREQRWANDAGSTTVIASGPDEADWSWRLSIARIENDGAFSEFADTQRQFVALDAPVQLTFSDGRDESLLRLSTIRFDGADAPHAHLPDGPTRAFNLMLRGSAQGELIARPLNGGMWLPMRSEWRWFVHLLSGSAQILSQDESIAIEATQSLWIDAQPDSRVRIEGGGELVLVQLTT